VSAVLAPPLRLAVRLPAVRVALACVPLVPAAVAWAGADHDAGLRLRLAGAGVAVLLTLAWDDRSATMTAPTPVGLPAVQRGRAILLVTLLAGAWLLAAAAAVQTSDAVPVGPLGLEALAVSALLLAAAGGLARGRDGESVAAYAVPGLLALLFLQSRLPAGWQLVSAGPTSTDVQQRWLVVLAVSAVLTAWVGRDPSARPFRAPGRRRPRHVASIRADAR